MADKDDILLLAQAVDRIGKQVAALIAYVSEMPSAANIDLQAVTDRAQTLADQLPNFDHLSLGPRIDAVDQAINIIAGSSKLAAKRRTV